MVVDVLDSCDGYETVLEKWKANAHLHKFVSAPQYYSVGDFVSYFSEDAWPTASNLNRDLEVYHAEGKLVGIRICGVKRLLGDRKCLNPVHLKELVLLTGPRHELEAVLELVGDVSIDLQFQGE